LTIGLKPSARPCDDPNPDSNPNPDPDSKEPQIYGLMSLQAMMDEMNRMTVLRGAKESKKVIDFVKGGTFISVDVSLPPQTSTNHGALILTVILVIHVVFISLVKISLGILLKCTRISMSSVFQRVRTINP